MTALALTPGAAARPSCATYQRDQHRWLNTHRCVAQPETGWQQLSGLAQLRRWPDLAEVPDQFTLSVARLCALLSRSATLIHQIPDLLGGDHDETHAAFQILKAFGYIEVSAAPCAMPSQPSMATGVASHQAGNPLPSGGIGAFIRSFCRRLIG